MALKRWAIADFGSGGTGSTQTLLTAAASKETMILSLLFANNSTTTDASVSYEHTDGTSVIFSFSLIISPENSPVAIDSVLVASPGDVIRIVSNIDPVSVIASGDEI